MELIALIIGVLVIGVVLGAGGVWVVVCRALVAKNEHLLEQKTQADLTRNTTEATLQAERQAAQAKQDLLTKTDQAIAERFTALAAQVLKDQNEGLNSSHRKTLDALLSPFKEQVDRLNRHVQEHREKATEQHVALTTVIEQLNQRSTALSQQALDLTNALRGQKQTQGAWGEMILTELLEFSGLRKGHEYETQVHTTDADTNQRYRPDVVVNLPEQKTLIIDAKVSLVAYTAAVAVNAPDNNNAGAQHIKDHINAVRTHIKTLAAKPYAHTLPNTPDYVIMFVPIEGALAMALAQDNKLITDAMEQGIALASPTTLMALLKTIHHIWSVERRNENAEKIAKRAGAIYDKAVLFCESMDHVGKGLNNAKTAYDKAYDQLSRGRGNLLGQVETLKQLGAKTHKTLPEHDPIELETAIPTAISTPEPMPRQSTEPTPLFIPEKEKAN